MEATGPSSSSLRRGGQHQTQSGSGAHIAASSIVYTNPSLQHMSATSSTLAGVLCMIAKCRFQHNDIYGTDVSAVNVPQLYATVTSTSDPLIEVSANPMVLLIMPKLLESRMYAALLNRAGIRTCISNNPLQAYRKYLAPTWAQRKAIDRKKGGGGHSTTITDQHQHARGDDEGGAGGADSRREDVKVSMVIADWGMCDERSGITPQDILQFLKRDAELLSDPKPSSPSTLIAPSPSSVSPPQTPPAHTVCFVALCGRGVMVGNAIRSGAHLFLRKPLMLHMQVIQKLLMPRAMAMPGFPAELLRQRANHEALRAVLSEALIGVGAEEMLTREDSGDTDDDEGLNQSDNSSARRPGGGGGARSAVALASPVSVASDMSILPPVAAIQVSPQLHSHHLAASGLDSTIAANVASVAKFVQKTADHLELQEEATATPSSFVSNMITYLKAHDPKHADARWHALLVSSVKALASAKLELQRMSREALRNREQCEVCWQQHRDVSAFKPEEYFLNGGSHGRGAGDRRDHHLTGLSRRELTMHCLRLSVRCQELDDEKRQSETALTAIGQDSADLRRAMDALLDHRRQQQALQDAAAQQQHRLHLLQQQQQSKGVSKKGSTGGGDDSNVNGSLSEESPRMMSVAIESATTASAQSRRQSFKLEESPSTTAATSSLPIAGSGGGSGHQASSVGKGSTSPLSPALSTLSGALGGKTPLKPSALAASSPSPALVGGTSRRMSQQLSNVSPPPPTSSTSAASLRKLIRKRSATAEAVAAVAAAALVSRRRYDAYERRMCLLETALMANEDWTLRFLPPPSAAAAVAPQAQARKGVGGGGPAESGSPKAPQRRKSMGNLKAPSKAEDAAAPDVPPPFTDCLNLWPPLIRFPPSAASGATAHNQGAGAGSLYRNLRGLVENMLKECALASKSLLNADPSLRDPLVALESHLAYHVEKFDAVRQFDLLSSSASDHSHVALTGGGPSAPSSPKSQDGPPAGGKKSKGAAPLPKLVVPPATVASGSGAASSPDGSPKMAAIDAGLMGQSSHSLLGGGATWRVAATSFALLNHSMIGGGGGGNPNVPPVAWRRQAPPEAKIFLHQVLQMQVNRLEHATAKALMARRFLLWLGKSYGRRRAAVSEALQHDKTIHAATVVGEGAKVELADQQLPQGKLAPPSPAASTPRGATVVDLQSQPIVTASPPPTVSPIPSQSSSSAAPLTPQPPATATPQPPQPHRSKSIVSSAQTPKSHQPTPPSPSTPAKTGSSAGAAAQLGGIPSALRV